MEFRDLIQSKNIIGQAPMDGITDEAFRLVLTRINKPDVIFTEFVSAEGISRGGVKLYDVLLYSSEEKPIVGQLFGKDPESFYKSAVILCHLGFDGIDINMGCPAKTVIQHGSGAALIGQTEIASQIINSAKKGIYDWFDKKVAIKDLGLNNKTLKIIDRNIKYSGKTNKIQKPTLSIKTRLGINHSIIDTWIPFLLDHKPDFITIHGRTLKQGYSGTADWDEISKAVTLAANSKTLIWGNGDIQSQSQAQVFCQKYQVKGILIGRALMGNPWVYLNHYPTPQERFSAMLLHSQIFKEVYKERKFDCMRKHFLSYTLGLPEAKKLRQLLIHVNSIDDLLMLEPNFLNC